jgi:hypothetical protein
MYIDISKELLCSIELLNDHSEFCRSEIQVCNKYESSLAFNVIVFKAFFPSQVVVYYL